MRTIRPGYERKRLNDAMIAVALLMIVFGIVLTFCANPPRAKGQQQPADGPDIILPLSGSNPPVGSIQKLTKGSRYVIRAKVKCDILSFPEGIVAVEDKTGPRDWTGIFVGGNGDYEDRHFAEPYLYALKAAGKGSVQVVIIPQGYKDKSQWVKTGLEVDSGDAIGAMVVPKSTPMTLPMPEAPNPLVEKADKVTVVVCFNGPLTDASRVVVQDDAFLRKLSAGGHKLELVELKATDPHGYKPYADRVGYPAVLVFDSIKEGAQIPLTFFKLPATGKEMSDSTFKVIK